MALAVGQRAPDFALCSHEKAIVRLSDYFGKRNVALVFFPLAWTPVWTSQIPSYQAALARFDGIQAQVLGLSVDSTDCLKAWADSLGGVSYPLLSDFYPHGQVAQMYGVFRSEGYSERAIFVIDKKGIIRYVDVHNIDQQPDNEILFTVLAELEPEAAAKLREAQERSPQPQPAAAASANVIIYCTPWCAACRRAKAYLKEKGISFAEIDISRDRAAAAQVRAWANGNETTPTFDVKGTIVVDYDKAKLDQALGLA